MARELDAHSLATVRLSIHLITPQVPPASSNGPCQVSWIDPDIGRLFLEGMAAARADRTEVAESLLLGVIWSKWGTRHKYRTNPPNIAEARLAYERS